MALVGIELLMAQAGKRRRRRCRGARGSARRPPRSPSGMCRRRRPTACPAHSPAARWPGPAPRCSARTACTRGRGSTRPGRAGQRTRIWPRAGHRHTRRRRGAPARAVAAAGAAPPVTAAAAALAEELGELPGSSGGASSRRTVHVPESGLHHSPALHCLVAVHGPLGATGRQVPLHTLVTHSPGSPAARRQRRAGPLFGSLWPTAGARAAQLGRLGTCSALLGWLTAGQRAAGVDVAAPDVAVGGAELADHAGAVGR